MRYTAFRLMPTLILTLACACSRPMAAGEQRAFPMALSYPGCIKPNTVDQAAMNTSILDFWTYYRTKYIKATTTFTGGYYVEMRTTNAGADDKSSSEATGYGMILSVLLAGGAGEPDTREYFDGFFKLFDRNRSGTNNELMSFTVGQNESTHANAATDGDMDIAYALLMAHYQWGSTGAINYLQEAKRIITEGIKKSEMGQASYRTLLGDWDKNGWNTRSSDWMAGHMLAYQKATGDAFWNEARKTVYSLIGQIGPASSPNTGLMPDFVVGNPPKAAPPKFLEKDTDGDYSWNACRFPLRLAVDFAHTGASESKAALAKISKWLAGATGGNPSTIKAGYRLDGTPLVTYSDMAFTAPLIASAIADASGQEFLNKGWAYLSTTKQNAYYGDSIELLTLLLLSGNWWAPDEKLPAVGLRRPGERDGYKGGPAIGVTAKGTATLDGRRIGPEQLRAAGVSIILHP